MSKEEETFIKNAAWDVELKETENKFLHISDPEAAAVAPKNEVHDKKPPRIDKVPEMSPMDEIIEKSRSSAVDVGELSKKEEESLNDPSHEDGPENKYPHFRNPQEVVTKKLETIKRSNEL